VAHARPWTAVADGVVVTVRLTPKGGRDAFDGIAALADGAPVLRARVCAAPSEGEANAALTRLLAKTVGASPGSIAIIGGAASRVKRVKIVGDATALSAALEKIAPAR
jgi:uncharacterized protein